MWVMVLEQLIVAIIDYMRGFDKPVRNIGNCLVVMSEPDERRVMLSYRLSYDYWDQCTRMKV